MNIEDKLCSALAAEANIDSDSDSNSDGNVKTNVEEIDLTKIDELDDESLDNVLNLLKADKKISDEFTVAQIRTEVNDEKKRRQATSLVRQIALVSVFHIFKKKSEMYKDNANFKILLSKFNIRKIKAISGEQFDFVNEHKDQDCLYVIVKPFFAEDGTTTRTHLDKIVKKFDPASAKKMVNEGLKMLEYTYNYYTDFYTENTKLLKSIAADNGEDISNYMMRIDNNTLDLCVGFPNVWFRIGLFTVFKSDGQQQMQQLCFDHWV